MIYVFKPKFIRSKIALPGAIFQRRPGHIPTNPGCRGLGVRGSGLRGSGFRGLGV